MRDKNKNLAEFVSKSINIHDRLILFRQYAKMEKDLKQKINNLKKLYDSLKVGKE